MTHTYTLRWLSGGRVVHSIEATPEWGRGYVACHREMGGPRLGLQLVRDDGRILDEAHELTEASIGLIAGQPTAEQYRAAAARSIAQAERIEAREAEIKRRKAAEIARLTRERDEARAALDAARREPADEARDEVARLRAGLTVESAPTDEEAQVPRSAAIAAVRAAWRSGYLAALSDVEESDRDEGESDGCDDPDHPAPAGPRWADPRG